MILLKSPQLEIADITTINAEPVSKRKMTPDVSYLNLP